MGQTDRPGRKLSGTGGEAAGVVGGNRLFAAVPLPRGGKHAGGPLPTAGGCYIIVSASPRLLQTTVYKNGSTTFTKPSRISNLRLGPVTRFLGGQRRLCFNGSIGRAFFSLIHNRRKDKFVKIVWFDFCGGHSLAGRS